MTMSAAPPARWNDKKFHFDPTKPRWPQIAKVVAQMAGLMGGLILALVSVFVYPMLLTGVGYALTYLGPGVVGFVATFFLIRDAWFPADMPAMARLQTRLGIGLFVSAWFIGAFGIANGYATPGVVQDAPMVYKRTSTQSDPKQKSYYVGARVWPSSRNVYEVIVRRDLYDQLDLPVVTQWHLPSRQLDAMPGRGRLRLLAGQGRFGINWLDGVIGVAPPDGRKSTPAGAGSTE